MYPRHRRLAVIFAATLASVLPLIGHAALPPSVDGQPLPSLAPMLEKVTPAVVNISTKTRVKVRDPFFDDPVFRQMFGLNGGARERVEQSLGSGVIVDAAKGYETHLAKGGKMFVFLTCHMANGRTGFAVAQYRQLSGINALCSKFSSSARFTSISQK